MYIFCSEETGISAGQKCLFSRTKFGVHNGVFFRSTAAHLKFHCSGIKISFIANTTSKRTQIYLP